MSCLGVDQYERTYAMMDNFFITIGGQFFKKTRKLENEGEEFSLAISAITQMPAENSMHIVTRYPLAAPGSVNPFLSLDYVSWILMSLTFGVLISILLASLIVIITNLLCIRSLILQAVTEQLICLNGIVSG